jgi:phosphopantothenoylcysteine decarboxylase / phosphopantothenate---cysteine ligase
VTNPKYQEKKILVGITGGIGAYKTCEVIRYLVKNGAEVKAVMTKAATEFITPLTMESITGHKVTTHIFPNHDPWNTEATGTHHISIAHWPDLFVIAPATANIIGKIAHGIADEVLSTVVMATTAPVFLAPAMNDKMYLNPMVQENINKLKTAGYGIIEPDTGFLACGYEGQGRLAGLDKIVWNIDKLLFRTSELNNRNVLITAGPTQEPIDPVRYITNYSSGKMGYALARQAALMGARVTLIAGPTALNDPFDVVTYHIKTADEMAQKVLSELPEQDIVIMAAAVADYKPVQPASQKIKKESTGTDIVLNLTQTPDILSEITKKKERQIITGFALETENEIENARKKLALKKLDLIVLNNPTQSGAGFNTDTNVITIIDPNHAEQLPLISKDAAARKILERVAQLINR